MMINKYQLAELLDIIHWSKSFAKTDGQYIRVRKAKEWVEDEIKQINREEARAKEEDETPTEEVRIQ